jgi:hypothetical protein
MAQQGHYRSTQDTGVVVIDTQPVPLEIASIMKLHAFARHQRPFHKLSAHFRLEHAMLLDRQYCLTDRASFGPSTGVR